MLKYFPLLFSLTCGPSEVKTKTIDTSPPVPVDPYPWATWETCAHNIGDNPCNFKLMDQNGNDVELYEHYGKVILIDFSAMWCGPCAWIAPMADQWIAQYGSDNFIWITVLIEDSTRSEVELQDLQSWANRHSSVAPILAGSREMIDTTEPLTDGYPIVSWPTIVIIDKTMVLQHGSNGWVQSQIQSWVENLL